MPTLSRGSVELYFEKWPGSDGSVPVMLLPGWGSNAAHFDELATVLARGRGVLSVDHRGAGRTTGATQFSMSDLADDVAAVLDAAGVDAAHVVGTSMGGMIAQELALRHPARIRTLTLACTTCGGARSVQPKSSIIQTLLSIRTRDPELLVELVGDILFAPATSREERLRVLRARAAFPPKGAGFLAQGQAIMGHDTHARLGGIALPTLVVTGDEDVLVPPANADVLAAAIPGARLVKMPGGHAFFVEHGDAFVNLLASFWAA